MSKSHSLFLVGLSLLLAGNALATPIDIWPSVQVELSGDFIGGYFNDDALMKTSGREKQLFKMSRGLIGFKARHESGFGGLFEYNFMADEPKRVTATRPISITTKTSGPNFCITVISRPETPMFSGSMPDLGLDSGIRAGRMVNILGFEEEEVPFWGRNDSPHAHFMTKEILNGIAVAAETSWLRLETALLSGRGRPDSDYNWYLQGQTDPNTKGNNTPVFEVEATLRWREYLKLSGGYHQNKTGSAPGSLFSGKHNDNRQIVGARLQTGYLGSWLNRIVVLGQFSRFEDGLTEDGSQGKTYPEFIQKPPQGWMVRQWHAAAFRSLLLVHHL